MGGPAAAKPTATRAAVATMTLVRDFWAVSASDQNRSRSDTDRPAKTSSGINPR
jgi:hypothetical protein